MSEATTAAASPGTLLSWGSATAQGPRPTMEDELTLAVDAKAGITYAAVFDGHGGDASAAWLVQHLMDDVLRAVVDKRLLMREPDAAPDPARPGVSRSARLSTLLSRVFAAADQRLIQHLVGEDGMGGA